MSAPMKLTRLCSECAGEEARYLADLGGAAPNWRGESYPLGERCAAELRVEGMVVSIRSVRPDEAVAAAFTVEARFAVEAQFVAEVL